jgi:DNA-binding CsgD family transcriptional regulator
MKPRDFDQLTQRLARRLSRRIDTAQSLSAQPTRGPTPASGAGDPQPSGTCPYPDTSTTRPFGDRRGSVSVVLDPGAPSSSAGNVVRQPSRSGRASRQRLDQALSLREEEVASLIAQGLKNREIAAELVLSERTVHAHVRNVLDKLGLTSRAQIAAWASAHGIREQSPSSGDRAPR